jgi:quinoprotein glucose dehydrogenase
MTRHHCLILGLLLASLVVSTTAVAQRGASGGEWRAYSADEGSTRYSPLEQIDRSNVSQLEIAWTWKFHNFGTQSQTLTTQTTPIMIDGVLYFTAGQRRTVVAADAGTGETLWIWRPDEGVRFDQAPRKVHRGVAYWSDGENARIVVVTPGFHLVALDARTGLPVESFGQGGIVDLFAHLDLDVPVDPLGRIGNSSPPVIANDIIVIGPAFTPGGRVDQANVKGDVMAFDARTGEKLWRFHTIPRKGEYGYDTWLDGSAEYTGNTGVWGPFSADPELGYVYLPIEAPTNDVYGGHRPGDNLFSGSLVCLDIRTGEMVWYRQLIRHDIWDYDMAAHPILVDLTVDGREIPAVVQLTKQAFAYVLDRRTGEPVWPFEDRPVQLSDVPGEWTSPTQPFPTRPPAFDVQGVSEDDVIDFTPALRAEALEVLNEFRIGPLYTPPSLIVEDGTRGTLTAPGFAGGANWPSGAADPETGFVYVPSVTSPVAIGLHVNQDADETGVDSDYVMGSTSVPTVQGLRLLKPPYGRITAFDMNRGEIAWQVPNGDTPSSVKENPALEGVTIPRTGSPSHAGLLVTRTLLFAGEGPTGHAVLHAYDKATGEDVWQAELPGAQSSLPMTYMHEGRQYVVVAVRASATESAQLVAFALPR